MTLSELQSVIIDKEGGHKFIIIKVIDGENSRLVVRADAGYEFHREILGKFKREFPEFNAYCIGGGRINVDPTNNIIKIWGKSGDFGLEPDRTETVKMLSEAFPDFKVESSMPTW